MFLPRFLNKKKNIQPHVDAEQASTLNDLLNASDSFVLDAYRTFRQHLDVGQLKNDLLECAATRAGAAEAVAATGISNFFPRMVAFVEHMLRTGRLTVAQADVLVSLIESGSAAIISSYHNARERDDPEALFEGLIEIANFYLSSESGNGGGGGGGEQQEEEERYYTERPDTPTPYGPGYNEDDIIEMYEDLVDANAIPMEAVDDLRSILLSGNPYVEAAIELYFATSDSEDFVDTLLRIVRQQGNDAGIMSPQDAYDEQQRLQAADDWKDTTGEGEKEDEEEEEMTWESIEGTVRLLDSLMSSGVFNYEDTRKLSMLLLSDYTSTQQEVLVAAYQLYEQDADVEEFVDTCSRVLSQLSKINEEHRHAFSSLLAKNERFDDYQQALLMTMWNSVEPRVLAAWDVYVYDRAESELVDTLSRIVSHEFEIDEDGNDMDLEESEEEDSVRGSVDPDDNMLRTASTQARHKRNFSEIQSELEELGQEEGSTSAADGGSATYHMVMAQVLDLMEVENHLDYHGRDTLIKLIHDGHTVVEAAYDAFSHDQDVDELMDTLRTVVDYVQNHHDDVNVRELLDFIEYTVQKGRMAPREGADAANLVEGRDPRVMAAYDVYYEEQDVEDLIDTIRTMVRVGDASSGASSSGSASAGGRFASGDPFSGEEEEAYVRAVENARRVVEACVGRGELNVEDAEALLDASDDPRLLAAVDNFAMDGLWGELCDTLRRLGSHLNGTYGYDERSTSEQQQQQRQAEVENDMNSSSEEEEEELMDEHAAANGYKYSYDTTDGEAGTTDYTDGDDMEEEEEEEEEMEASQDGEEDDEVEIVDVADLVLRMRLTKEEKMTIYDLLRQEDPMVNAAFEIYDADRDLQDLKDTLQRVVSRYSPQQQEEEDEEVEEDDDADQNYDEDSIAEKVFGNLERNGIITADEKERFVMLLDGGDIVASAALEVFGLDGDHQDFVDTMRRIPAGVH